MAHLAVDQLTKTFGAQTAVERFTYDFADGAITTIVGPSGSGKSTLLWMIAGLLSPDSGSVRLNGADATHIPPERRDIGMVFQNYALFPHLTVRQNVEFGLRVRGVSASERSARAREMLALVRIPHLAERRVQQISGGEQQRVALARALAYRPNVLLMDEPLAALDAKLRDDLRIELFRLLHDLRITTVYVTHDQTEALSLGDELVVMNCGRIEQAGSPLNVYRRPAGKFVAEFLGAANVFEAVCAERAGERVLVLPFGEIPAPPDAAPGECWAMIRPEDVSVAEPGSGLAAEFESALFLGSQRRVHFRVGSARLVADVNSDVEIFAGQPVSVRFNGERIYVWPRAVRDSGGEMA